MKHYILLGLLVCSGGLLPAQKFADGYFVTLNNDPVKTKIKIPKDLFGDVQIEVLEKKNKRRVIQFFFGE